MNSKEYFEKNGISLEEAFQKNEQTQAFAELYKMVEKADIPEGDISTPGSREYFRYKIGFCVTRMDEDDIKEGDMLNAWTKVIEKLPVKLTKYLEDDEIREFSTRESLGDYLNFRLQNDIWVVPFINECSCIGIDICTNVKEETMRNCVESLVTDEMINETLNSKSKLILVFPLNYQIQAIPVRSLAFNDICQRARLSGGIIEQTQDKGSIRALPAAIKGQWLSTGFSLNSEFCKILIRDGKISAMKSQRYVAFPEMSVVYRLENQLNKNWPGYCFCSASVSHEYLSVNYTLNAVNKEEAFKANLEDLCEKKFTSVSFCVNLTTSDVGMSAVTVTPFCIADGLYLPIGEKIRIRHDNGNTLDDYSKAISTLEYSIRVGIERFLSLGYAQKEQEIHYPVDCFSHIASDFKFPKNICTVIANRLKMRDMDGKCSALDIILSLCEIIDQCRKKNPAIQDMTFLYEQMINLLHTEIAEYDYSNEQ